MRSSYTRHCMICSSPPVGPSLLSKSAGTGGSSFPFFSSAGPSAGFTSAVVADHLGRTKTLIITILIYAIFTGLAALSHDWWHLAIYRFLTALGIGGEWAAGAALVAETWPEEKRAKAAGILQSAWAIGFFLAASFNLLLKGYGWRVMFVIGVLPAFVSLLVRWHVKEPDRWAKAHNLDRTIISTHMTDIFHPPFRRSTFVGSALAFVAVFGLWGSTNWAPTLIRELPDLKGSDTATLSASVSYAIMALNAGSPLRLSGLRPTGGSLRTSACLCLHVPRQLRDAADHVSAADDLCRRLDVVAAARIFQ